MKPCAAARTVFYAEDDGPPFGLGSFSDDPQGWLFFKDWRVSGSSVEMLADLVQSGLATVVTESMREPRGVINMIERIRITDAGRHAIKD